MSKTIMVAGGTGNLGQQIVTHLLKKGVNVRVPVRNSTSSEKIKELTKAGAETILVNMQSVHEVANACKDVSCVVSALSGLRDVIIDTQKVLLDAAVKAGVPRFIPSDYSLDFTRFAHGENRNLDWRREFHTHVDVAPIKATTIFNGAFADMLTGQMPLILFKKKRILYWGNAQHKMSFTTIANTAQYTANAALDDDAPRFLRIAGDYKSPFEIKEIMTRLTGEKYTFFRPGGPGLLSAIIKITQLLAPAKNELYPAWQGMQYMRNMIDKRCLVTSFDNNRYKEMEWTSIEQLLARHLAGTG